MNLYGFTLLRNGIKYDYPFRESLQSLCSLCSSVYIALGQSEDGTEQELNTFSNIEIIPTTWDENLRKSGIILSQQTNIALEKLRSEKSQEQNAWGFYLQADEVLSETDFPLIRQDIQRAEEAGADAISFRYLHFWRSYDRIAIGKRWYPQEIRAIKLNSKSSSYGDAQGFRGQTKVYYSDAHIYHYGHVREEEAYQKKLKEFGRWWHNDEELKKVVEKGFKRDRYEESIPYLGKHPAFMQERMQKMGWNPTTFDQKRELLLYGQANSWPQEFNLPSNTKWSTSVLEMLSYPKENVIQLQELPWYWNALTLGQRTSKVPVAMKSPQARPWNQAFLTMLRFSEKGIPLVQQKEI